MSTDHPWRLAEQTHADLADLNYSVAILPFGCTEPHDLHLPFGTDTYEAECIGDRICSHAWGQGARTCLLPTIPYGSTSNQSGLPLSTNVNPTTLHAFAMDVIRSLVGHGIDRILLLNSHGGNELKPILREAYSDVDAALFLCNWYTALDDVYSEIFDVREDHAGEMETSIMLAYRPDLVRRSTDGSLACSDGRTNLTRFKAVNEGWISITRPWHLLTETTGTADARAATAEKGEQALEILAQRIGGCLGDLAGAKRDTRFPF